MKTIPVILLFLLSAANFVAYSQKSSLQIEVKFLPGLEKFLKDNEIRIIIFADSASGYRKSVYGTGIIQIDSLYGDNITVLLASYIKKGDIEKDFSLAISDICLYKDSTTKVVAVFPPDCSYNRHVLNRTCPKCNKRDKVIPIKYGLRVPLYDKNGNIIDEGEYRPRGCVVSDCDPSWYCKRDKVEF